MILRRDAVLRGQGLLPDFLLPDRLLRSEVRLAQPPVLEPHGLLQSLQRLLRHLRHDLRDELRRRLLQVTPT